MLASRNPGRIILLGITTDNRILARLIGPDDTARAELLSKSPVSVVGVFTEIDTGQSPREELLTALRRIADAGWHDASRLDSNGNMLPWLEQTAAGSPLKRL
jgi:hypothetical protein